MAAVELREFLFAPLAGQLLPFAITARQGGVFSGATRLKELAATLELETAWIAAEGTPVDRGSCIFRARGKAEAIVRAEEMLLGVIGKP
ncbi:MAG: nicotinate-nucleotide pyrophosphorylase, partial [Moorella sp. (in: Bacteria)]|nr:nicotinate-nucleotide pyrophosphorylase [Moorella sp. (in: firmicutes)]